MSINKMNNAFLSDDNLPCQDVSGRWFYPKDLNEYYQTCLSYVPTDVEKELDNIRKKDKEDLNAWEEKILSDDLKRQRILEAFDNVCVDQADTEDLDMIQQYTQKYSLEDLVRKIIPLEFDNVYTTFNLSSSTNVKELIRFINDSSDNNQKVPVITAYLNYRLDDRATRRSMVNTDSMSFNKAQTGKVKQLSR